MRQAVLLAPLVLVVGAAVAGCNGSGPAGDAAAVDVRQDGPGQQEVSVPDQGSLDQGGGDLPTGDAVVPDGSGPGASWVVFGGSSEAPASGREIAVDTAGNSYVAGAYSGGAIMLGTTALPSRTEGTPLVAKLDPSGKVLWAQALTDGTSVASARDLVVDSAGKVYVTGSFKGTVTLGSMSLTSLGDYDGFVAQLDSSGKVQWVASFASLQAIGPVGIQVDGSGCSYITGNFKDTAIFGSTSLTAAGSNDIFVAKLSAAGKFSWAVSGGGTDLDAAGGIALDGSGELRIAASIYGAATFGSITVAPKQTVASVVAKLDGTGKFLWASQGDGAYLQTRAIGVDGAGNSYVTGTFGGQATFGTTVLSQLPTTTRRQYVVKLSPVGTILWAAAGGGGYSDDLAVDSSGNSVITGISGGQTTFGSVKVTGFGGGDVVVARLDAQGAWTAATMAGGAMEEVGNGVALDSAGNAYVTGSALSPISGTIPTVNTDTLTFGAQKTTITGMSQLFVWKVPASAL